MTKKDIHAALLSKSNQVHIILAALILVFYLSMPSVYIVYAGIAVHLLILQASVNKFYRQMNRVVSEVKEIERGFGELAQRAPSAKLVIDSTKHEYLQVESLINLRSLLNVKGEFPSMTGWAACPEVSLALANIIREKSPNVIMDLGSGISTLISALMLKQMGGGRIISIENSEEFYLKTRKLLDEFDVGDFADLYLVPMVEQDIAGDTYSYYDLSNIDIPTIDVLFVDGPWGGTQPLARYPAVPLLREKLATDSVIVVDDYNRKDERKIVDKWVSLLPENFSVDKYVLFKEFSKGYCIIRG